MTTVVPAQCFACTRLHSDQDPNTGTPLVKMCAAFPDGIPFEIAIGADHREARGDERGGMLFHQSDAPAAREAFASWKRTFGDA